MFDVDQKLTESSSTPMFCHPLVLGQGQGWFVAESVFIMSYLRYWCTSWLWGACGPYGKSTQRSCSSIIYQGCCLLADYSTFDKKYLVNTLKILHCKAFIAKNLFLIADQVMKTFLLLVNICEIINIKNINFRWEFWLLYKAVMAKLFPSATNLQWSYEELQHSYYFTLLQI